MEGVLSRLDLLSWDREATQAYGRLRARVEASSQKMDSMYMLIFAHASAAGAVLVTNDKGFAAAGVLDRSTLRMSGSIGPLTSKSLSILWDASWPESSLGDPVSRRARSCRKQRRAIADDRVVEGVLMLMQAEIEPAADRPPPKLIDQCEGPAEGCRPFQRRAEDLYRALGL
jgi:hypothetical protein